MYTKYTYSRGGGGGGGKHYVNIIKDLQMEISYYVNKKSS